MGLMERIHSLFSGEKVCPPEHLDGYRRIGEQVYELQVQLSHCETAQVRATVFAAVALKEMADALLEDGFRNHPVPLVTHEQAEEWYGMIPDIMVAARKENIVVGSGAIRLPIRLQRKVEAQGTCPVSHLAGLRRACEALSRLVDPLVSGLDASDASFQPARLMAVEAQTRKQVADAIVGQITSGQRVAGESHEEAEEQYWTALSAYLSAGQASLFPACLERTKGANRQSSKLDRNDVWKITSNVAKREIERDGDWWKAERDLEELWRLHTVTDEEREYEATVEDLLHRHQIREDGYWACCPFQPTYKVVSGPIEVLGHTLPTGYAFVWDYGEDGEPGQFISKSSFQRADERQYCGDED